MSPHDELAGDGSAQAARSGHDSVREPSAQRDASRHRRRLRPTAPRGVRCRCRTSRCGVWQASPRPVIFCNARPSKPAVDRILLIGGDDSPAGPFRASLDLLAPAWWSGRASVMWRSPAIPRAIRQSIARAGCRIAGQGGTRYRSVDWMCRWSRSSASRPADPALDCVAACAGHHMSGSCRHCRTRERRDIGKVRCPLRHRRFVA